MSSRSQVISLNLLPILTVQIKARADDWKGKVGQMVSEREEREKEGGRGGGRKMEQNYVAGRGHK